MINPGTAPIPDATEDLAAANMTVFAEQVAEQLAEHDLTLEQPQRDPEADTDGRFGWVLSTADGATVRVLMPGAPLERVRGDRSPTAPCLHVGGEPWWWPSAVMRTAGALRG